MFLTVLATLGTIFLVLHWMLSRVKLTSPEQSIADRDIERRWQTLSQQEQADALQHLLVQERAGSISAKGSRILYLCCPEQTAAEFRGEA